MNAVCLIVAGVVRATLPGPDFTLAWTHSVEKTRWEEAYRVSGDRLTLVEAQVEGSGAGMEAPAGAQLRNGRWIWQPRSTHAELRLTRSGFTPDYTLCAGSRCADLDAWLGSAANADLVSVRACASSASAGGKEIRR